MHIETERLWIRAYQMTDLPQLHRILSDPATMAFWPSPFTQAQSRQWLDKACAAYEHGLGRFAVVSKNSQQIVGDVGLVLAEIDGRQEMDLGYIVHAEQWGRGFGLEAAKALMKYGFEQICADRIVANMPTDHVRSRSIAEKLGMKLEKQFHHVRNRNILTCLYVKYREECT